MGSGCVRCGERGRRDQPLARTPQPPEPGHDPESPPRAIVVLHVPGFAAKHAATHHSPNLTAAAGPVVPANSAPSPDQIRYAAPIHGGRTHHPALSPRAGHPARAQRDNGTENL